MRTVSLLAGAAGLTVALTAAAPARAQFFFDYGTYNAPYGAPVKRKQKRAQPVDISRTDPDAAKADKMLVERKPEGPLVLSVSLRRQRVAVYDSKGLMMEAPISSGRVGNATPTGVFSIVQKNRMHYSNLYDSAPMPNMQRITWSGVALHAGVLPGYPASHGCIRLPHGFSKRLFELTTMGTRVIVAQDPVEPVAFTHPRLFAAYPAAGSATHALLPSATRVADASAPRSGTPADVGSVIGVSTAVAAEAPSRWEAIEAWRADRRKELDDIAAAIASATAAKAEALAKATDRVKAADVAKAALRAARTEVGRLAADVRKAEQARDAAEKRLEAFERDLNRKTSFTPADIETAAAEEDRLETEAMDLDDAAMIATAAVKAGAEALATAEKAMIEADKARAEAVNAVRAADTKVALAREADAAAKRREAKRKEPVHVFISRKTQKIYVRQGYEPILEAAVSIDQPELPLGTHVFTALAVDPARADVDWSVASIPSTASGIAADPRDRKAREVAAADAARRVAEARATQTADAALRRIAIPADVRLQIEDVMKPGSSLIISDNGLSNETGKYTDFIVSLR